MSTHVCFGVVLSLIYIVIIFSSMCILCTHRVFLSNKILILPIQKKNVCFVVVWNFNVSVSFVYVILLQVWTWVVNLDYFNSLWGSKCSLLLVTITQVFAEKSKYFLPFCLWWLQSFWRKRQGKRWLSIYRNFPTTSLLPLSDGKCSGRDSYHVGMLFSGLTIQEDGISNCCCNSSFFFFFFSKE